MFGIYLIHDSFIGRPLIWYVLFNVTDQYQSKYFPLMAFGTCMIVFVVCAMIDFLRIKLIEPRMMKVAQNKIDKWKDKYLT